MSPTVEGEILPTDKDNKHICPTCGEIEVCVTTDKSHSCLWCGSTWKGK